MADPPSSGPLPAATLLGHLYEIGRLLQTFEEPDDFLGRLLDLALQVLEAERGLAFLTEEPGIPRVERGGPAAGWVRSAVDEALAGRPVLWLHDGADAVPDHLHAASLQGLRSLLCVPLRLPDGVIGALYLDSRRDGSPFRAEHLRFMQAFAAQAALALRSASLVRDMRRENRRLTSQAAPRDRFEGILGRSAPMQAVYELIERAGPSPFPVLVSGESGTGKELVARALHAVSQRRSRPFLAVNCAALSEALLESEIFGHRRGAFTGADTDRTGLFELADGGTLLLDEVAGMSPALQAKLLRVLESGEFRPLGAARPRRSDVRLIASTHADLPARVASGEFREDLFYRLNVLRIDLAPLRERAEDVPMLVSACLARLGLAGGVEVPEMRPEALRLLARHSWPGNVRELEYAVQKLALFAAGRPVDAALVRRVLPRATSAAALAPIGGFPTLETVRRQHIERTLDACGGDIQEAARRLRIGRATLYRRLRDLRPPGQASSGQRSPS